MRLLVAFVLLGCGTAPSPERDAGLDVASLPDAALATCEVDAVCPDQRPWPGAPCAVSEVCTYDAAPACTVAHRYDCAGGVWVYTAPAVTDCGFPPSPQLGERCRTPFAGTSAGTVSAEILGDRFVWGSQGTAMVDLDLALDGEAAALECVHVAIRTTIDGTPFDTPFEARLRCGRTRTYVPILAADVSRSTPYAVELVIDVTGVGSVTRTATLLGGR